MLIGLFGPHAVGKTTYLRNSMDALADVTQPDLRIVLADLRQEFILTPDRQSWLKKRQVKWQGNAEEREALMRFCAEDSAVWIVESAWFFRGMHTALNSYTQQVKFIIPITQPAILKHFLVTRCEEQSKPFRGDHWDDPRLVYESSLRYTNFAGKLNSCIERCIFDMDAERLAWEQAFERLKGWLQ